MSLRHWTCRHAARSIDKRGLLVPMPQVGWRQAGLTVVWLTDLAEPDREGLGLTSVISPCDRTEVCYEVDPDFDAARPFDEWWRAAGIDPRVVSLMTYPPKQPRHWFVSIVDVPVVRA